MTNPRKRVSRSGKVLAGVCAAVVGTVINSTVWYALAFLLEPPAIVYVVGGLVTLGVIVAALYTWAVDGPVQWRSKPKATSRA